MYVGVCGCKFANFNLELYDYNFQVMIKELKKIEIERLRTYDNYEFASSSDHSDHSINCLTFS